MMIKYRKYIYPLFWLILLIYASVSSPSKIPNINLFEHADKVVHFIFYFVFTILLIPVFVKKSRYYKSFLLSFFAATTTGIIFELIQYHATSSRSGDLSDVIANTLGAMSGLLFYNWFIKGKKIEKIFF